MFSEIKLTQTQMQEAVAHYLNTQMLKENVRVKVTRVEHDKQPNQNHFVVGVAEANTEGK